jgi:hypothetical protein
VNGGRIYSILPHVIYTDSSHPSVVPLAAANVNAGGNASITTTFGAPGRTPIVGHWKSSIGQRFLPC